MTIQDAKNKVTDRDLRTKSCHADLATGTIVRLIGIGRKYLRIMYANGVIVNVDPTYVAAVWS